MDIFVFSTTKDEGFGIALVEAMGKGIPIIASNVGACSEVLLNGECGILFDFKSPNSIYKAVEKVLNHPDYTSKIVSKSNYNNLYRLTKKMADLYFQELEQNNFYKQI